MRACLPGFRYAFDLGQEWRDWTGLPFVYAFWAVRPGADLGPVEAALHEAKRRGLERVGPIAAREAPRLGLDAGFCRRYLRTSSTSTWGRANRRGCTTTTCWPASWGWPRAASACDSTRSRSCSLRSDALSRQQAVHVSATVQHDSRQGGGRRTADARRRAGRCSTATTCTRWAGPPTPSAAGCTPSRTAPTTSTATSTTPTSAPPSATSAPSTARPATPTPTSCRARSCTRRSRRPSPWAATRS